MIFHENRLLEQTILMKYQDLFSTKIKIRIIRKCVVFCGRDWRFKGLINCNRLKEIELGYQNCLLKYRHIQDGICYARLPLVVTHICVMETVHIQWQSSTVSPAIRGRSYRQEFAPFPFREVPILKRGAIDENYCSLQ